MGADNAGSFGDGVQFRYAPEQPKIEIVSGFVVGLAGDGGVIPAVRDYIANSWTTFNGGSLMLYLENYASDLRGVIREYADQSIVAPEENSPVIGFEMLIGAHGQLAHVNHTATVTTFAQPYAAIGSGYAIAWGALAFAYRTQPDLPPKDILTAALLATCDHSEACREPIDVL